MPQSTRVEGFALVASGRQRCYIRPHARQRTRQRTRVQLSSSQPRQLPDAQGYTAGTVVVHLSVCETCMTPVPAMYPCASVSVGTLSVDLLHLSATRPINTFPDPTAHAPMRLWVGSRGGGVLACGSRWEGAWRETMCLTRCSGEQGRARTCSPEHRVRPCSPERAFAVHPEPGSTKVPPRPHERPTSASRRRSAAWFGARQTRTRKRFFLLMFCAFRIRSV